jgi:type IV fimbrial biogenesis protein FimT
LLEVTPMRRHQGFTLLELMVVLSILGIMLAVGIPGFRDFISNQRAKSASYELITSLMMARSEAVKRNATVKVEPVTANTWTSGWNVTVVSSSATLQNQDTLNGLTITGSAASITFSGAGRPTGGAATWEISSNNLHTRCVKLDLAGVPSSTSGACS